MTAALGIIDALLTAVAAGATLTAVYIARQSLVASRDTLHESQEAARELHTTIASLWLVAASGAGRPRRRSGIGGPSNHQPAVRRASAGMGTIPRLRAAPPRLSRRPGGARNPTGRRAPGDELAGRYCRCKTARRSHRGGFQRTPSRAGAEAGSRRRTKRKFRQPRRHSKRCSEPAASRELSFDARYHQVRRTPACARRTQSTRNSRCRRPATCSAVGGSRIIGPLSMAPRAVETWIG
jgi:hypothetical protein